jgi:predicted nucleic acid-binding protein
MGAIAKVVGAAHGRDAGVLYRQLRRSRTRVGSGCRVRPAPHGDRSAWQPLASNDLWIAASATANGLPLVTLNRRHFEPLTLHGLRLL